MKVLKSIEEALRIRQADLALVPTMGALHKGHAHLIKRSVKENKKTCVSIFVNPTQFNNSKDFETYPLRTEQDLKICEDLGVDYVFMPDSQDMYRKGESIKLEESDITTKYEGAYRPGHFPGVMLVVLKLFGTFLPDKAYFGKKDFQQYLLIKRMSEQFFLPTQVVGVETQRDEFGLPLSSRNLNLSKEGLERARFIASSFLKSKSEKDFRDKIKGLTDLEYYGEDWGRALMAHYIEGVRLIDNKEISL